MSNQWQNILIGAIGNLGAKEIGGAAHGSLTQNQDGTLTYVPPSIDKATQLTLHAGLGAGIAALSGNDPLSGAVSGVVGELVASPTFDALNKNSMNSNGAISNDQFLNNRALAVQLSGLAGGLSSIFTANAMGLEDQQVANNIFSGYTIGKNAAENNDLAFQFEKGDRSKFGHLAGYFQREDGAWVKYDQGIPQGVEVSPLALLNKGHQQGISLTLDDNITSEYLKARNDVVYIQTTREQDDQILQNVVTKINNVDTEPYRLWSNSCVDSFSDVCFGAGIKLPSNALTLRPDTYFYNLKAMYPDNYTNKTY